MNEELLQITDIILSKNTNNIPLTEEEIQIACKYYALEKIHAMRMGRPSDSALCCNSVEATKKRRTY